MRGVDQPPKNSRIVSGLDSWFMNQSETRAEWHLSRAARLIPHHPYHMRTIHTCAYMRRKKERKKEKAWCEMLQINYPALSADIEQIYQLTSRKGYRVVFDMHGANTPLSLGVAWKSLTLKSTNRVYNSYDLI